MKHISDLSAHERRILKNSITMTQNVIETIFCIGDNDEYKRYCNPCDYGRNPNAEGRDQLINDAFYALNSFWLEIQQYSHREEEKENEEDDA